MPLRGLWWGAGRYNCLKRLTLAPSWVGEQEADGTGLAPGPEKASRFGRGTWYMWLGQEPEVTRGDDVCEAPKSHS